MISKATRSETLSETLLSAVAYIARIMAFAGITTAVVLVVDAVALRLLNLSWNLDTRLDLLFWEGLVTVMFGATGWWWGEQPYHFTTPTGSKTYKIETKYRYPWFWVSVGIAGILLWVLATYLFLHYY